MIRTLLLLGATGDLARRFLFPALGTLIAAGRVPEGFRIVGAARGELDEERVSELAGGAVPSHAFTYHAVDLADPPSLAAALGGIADPVAVYLALPPAVYATTIESLGALGLPRGSRVAVEKPFGDDVDSARALNELLARTGLDAYRVDHVLGMETVQNLVAVKRDNPVLDALWNGDSVERIEILWEETLALEGRAGYYDHAGALKDVLQSHMLQVLALVAMEPAHGGDFHARKYDVLTSLGAPLSSRRARYTAGKLADGRDVPAYADEEGVDPTRCTETFAEVVFELDCPRWSQTRVVLRAGKALARRRKLALLGFRDGSELEFGIDGPEDVVLRVNGAGDERLALRAPSPGAGLQSYAHVLLDVLRGTHVFSVGAGEAEQAWRIVAPVLAAWEAGEVPLEEYEAGSVRLGHAVDTT